MEWLQLWILQQLCSSINVVFNTNNLRGDGFTKQHIHYLESTDLLCKQIRAPPHYTPQKQLHMPCIRRRSRLAQCTAYLSFPLA